MTKLTIEIDTETASPRELEFIQRFLRPGRSAKADMAKVVDDLMANIGLQTRLFVKAFVDAAEDVVDGPITLQSVAEKWGVPYETVRSKRRNLGRSMARLEKKYPDLPKLFEGTFDNDAQETHYVVEPDFREAVWEWEEKYPERFQE